MSELTQEHDVASDLADTASLPTHSRQSINSSPTKRREKRTRKFSDLSQDDELDRSAIEQQLNTQQIVTTTHDVPRAVPQRVHSVYPQMFVNTVNSGDLVSIQKYFQTFMAGPCTFVASHRVAPHFGIPHFISAFSPQLFSHYLLGCYVTFPDMVLKLGETRAFAGAGRTRIEMEVNIYLTKLYDIPNFLWAPEADELSGAFRSLRLGPAKLAGSVSSSPTPAHQAPSRGKNGKGGSKGSTNKTSNGKGAQTPDHSVQPATAPKCAVLTPSADGVAALQRLPLIPTSYHTAVVDSATVCMTPIPLHSRGVITMFLDENNNMQHLTVDMTEQKTLSAKTRKG
jgi:hypothetical protein